MYLNAGDSRQSLYLESFLLLARVSGMSSFSPAKCFQFFRAEFSECQNVAIKIKLRRRRLAYHCADHCLMPILASQRNFPTLSGRKSTRLGVSG